MDGSDYGDQNEGVGRGTIARHSAILGKEIPIVRSARTGHTIRTCFGSSS
jgi:hypothetical protein